MDRKGFERPRREFFPIKETVDMCNGGLVW